MTNMIRLLAMTAVLSFAFNAQAQTRNRNRTTTAPEARTTTVPETRSYATRGGSFVHEIQTYGTSGAFLSGKQCKNCDSGTTIIVGASYLYTLQDNIQVGGDGALRILSKEVSGVGKSVTTLEAIGIGVFNFDSDFANAFYAKGGIGLYSVLNDTASDYENKLGLQIGGGKRFPLFSNVTYNPEINLIKKGDIDFMIEIKLINLGISW